MTSEVKKQHRKPVELFAQSLFAQLLFAQSLFAQSLFAPIRHNRLSDLIERAVELGVKKIFSIISDHSAYQFSPHERIEKITISALTQSGSLAFPNIANPAPLHEAVGTWQGEGSIFLCAETGPAIPILEGLYALEKQEECAFLIDPEGGFSPREYNALGHYSQIKPVRLGKNILRSETAAAMALSC